MATSQLLSVSDNAVILQGYTLVTTGALVTDAVMSFSAYLNDGSGMLPVGPIITKTLVRNCNGVSMPYCGTSIYGAAYIGLLPGSADIVPDAYYWIVVSSSNYADVFQDWFQAVVRTSSTG